MITILDGSMGGELIRRGAASVTGLWSAQALLDAPKAVLQLHADYIAAGANVITTNSYSTIPSYLGKSDLARRYIELTSLAGELARKAANDSDTPVKVAGSVPPLSESYRPDMVPDQQQAEPIYKSMVIALRDYVDLFICETMSSSEEAIHAVSQVMRYGNGKPVMVSWTLKEKPGAGLRSGETILEAFNRLQEFDIDGFLFNCTHPEAIIAALGEIRQLTDKPIGGYPNRLNPVDPQWTLDNEIATGLRTDMDVAYFLEMATLFKKQVATIIGGCCGIGPEYIAALAKDLS